jgi:acetolactate synthase-1/2/3 large subunit
LTTTVAQSIASALVARGVRVGFGIPGGVLLDGIEALRALGVDFVLVRHEGSAGFMADVVHQLTGTPGLCIATLGPGVTNLVSPLAGAKLDRSRIFALTAQCHTDLIGRYTHQIMDQVAVLSPVCAVSAMVDPKDPNIALAQVFSRLDTGTPGPVHLDVPANAWTQSCRPIAAPAHTPFTLDTAAIRHVQKAVQSAQRPVMVVGIGDISNAASQSIRAWATKARIPVLTTYRAKGVVDENSPWSAGAFGLSPVVDTHQQAFIDRADLLIAVGLDPVELRAHWLPGWRSDLPMLAIDPRGQMDLCHSAKWDLRGPVGPIIEALDQATGGSTWTPKHVREHKANWAPMFEDGADGPANTIRGIQRGLGPEGIVSVDVGAHRITASHVWHCTRPREMLQSNGFSTMGTGLPGAIAARIAVPDRPAVALCGDAGLWMSMGELGIVQDRDLDLVVVYLADRTLSLIALKQDRRSMPTCGVGFTNPDVRDLARAFGGVGVSVRGDQAVEAAVRQGVQSGGLHIIEAQIDASAYQRQM